MTSAIPQLYLQSPANSLLSVTFFSAQDGLKNRSKIFLNCLVLWKPKSCLKGTVAQDYLPLIFFHEPRPDSTVNNMSKIAEMKLSSCGFEVADIRKNCDCGITELRLPSNIALKSGIAIAEVFPSSCGIAIADSIKSCACPPLQGPQHDNCSRGWPLPHYSVILIMLCSVFVLSQNALTLLRSIIAIAGHH